jgi:hypothetical protein
MSESESESERESRGKGLVTDDDETGKTGDILCLLALSSPRHC